MDDVCDSDVLISAIKSEEKNRHRKKKFGTSLQKKWKVLRDGYSRYIKKIKPKSGSAASNVRSYVYHQHLSFLKAVMEDRPDKTDSLTESEDAETSKMLEENDNSQNTPRIKKNNYKRKLSTEKEDILID